MQVRLVNINGLRHVYLSNLLCKVKSMVDGLT